MSSTKKICIDVKTFGTNVTELVSFRCFSDGTIEKYDYIVPKWGAIGNGKDAEIHSGICVGFSIHFITHDSFYAVRWFEDGTVQQTHPYGAWFTLKDKM